MPHGPAQAHFLWARPRATTLTKWPTPNAIGDRAHGLHLCTNVTSWGGAGRELHFEGAAQPYAGLRSPLTSQYGQRSRWEPLGLEYRVRGGPGEAEATQEQRKLVGCSYSVGKDRMA